MNAERAGEDGAAARLRQSRGLLVVLLPAVALVVVLVHLPVLRARALSFDDQQYLTANYLVRNPSLASARTFLSEVRAPSTVRGYYQPLAMISLMLDAGLGGTPENLRPFHRTSLALHALNSVLLTVWLYLLFGDALAAGLCGVLFGVHPMTVEAIAWVGERKTPLAALFAFGCLAAHVAWVRGRSRGMYLLAVLLCALALLSKPTATPLPLLLLLLDGWPLGRLGRRAVIEKAPFLLLAVVSSVVTYISQKGTASVELPTDSSLSRIPLTLCHNTVFYLGKVLWPVRLSSHYPVPQPLDLQQPMVLAGVVGTALLLVGLVLSLARTRALAAGFLFFFVAILPTMGIVGFTNVIASDKYAYLPLAGYLLIVCRALVWLGERDSHGGSRAPLLLRWLATLAVAMALAMATRAYLADWQDSVKLFQRMVRLAPRSPSVHLELGIALAREGSLDAALPEFRTAVALPPTIPAALSGLGTVLADLGQTDEAIPLFERTIALDPEDAVAHNNLGNALRKHGRTEAAERELRLALRLKPSFPEARSNLAVLLTDEGRWPEARQQLEAALRLDRSFPEAHNNLGILLASEGQLGPAVAEFKAALACRPSFAEAGRNLGQALLASGDAAAAIAPLSDATRREPGSAAGHQLLAQALARTGRDPEAIEHFRTALALRPGWEEAERGLAAALGR